MGCPPATELLDFADGRSVGEAGALAHLEGCASCSKLVADARERRAVADASATLASSDRGPGSSPDGEVTVRSGASLLRKGALVGRYVALELLGAGGMGVVYSAYDPDLDRRIALKLLRPEKLAGVGADYRRARILREAQAMARLSHAAVVPVYDVGTVGEQIYIAMELIEGGTLADWLGGEPRSWREITRVLCRAGEGLAAAHAVGVVHRDFKPYNVLVGRRGEVRVTDFGLARLDVTSGGDEGAAPAPLPVPVPQDAPVQGSLTQPGAVVGSPGYMAPEQMEGRAVDARSDQFSFCVTAWQSLYGELPYSGRTLAELHEAVMRGQLRPAPAGTRVPAWLRRTLLRGLAAKPGERYPSMAALLHALSRDPAHLRRRFLSLLGVVALTAALALGWRAKVTAAVRACGGSSARLAGIWDAPRKRAVRDAFTASGIPCAATAFATTQKAIDTWTAAWVAMRTEACESTSVRHEQSPELLDLRMSCLDDRLRDLSAKVELFTHADKEVVKKSPGQLDDLAACADARALRSGVRPPKDAQVREKVAEVRGRLASAQALYDVDKYAEGLALAQPILEQAKAIGYRPLEAEAGLLTGALQYLLDQAALAATTLREAAVAAEAGGADALVARNQIALARALSVPHPGQAEEAIAWAAAALERAGDDRLLSAWLEDARGWVLLKQSNPQAALSHDEAAVALASSGGPANLPVLMHALRALGSTLVVLGRQADARVIYQRTLTLDAQSLGPGHPDLADDEDRVGTTFVVSDLHQARIHYERAVQIAERSLGPENLDVAWYQVDLAWACTQLDDFASAEPILQRALRTAEHLAGPESAAAKRAVEGLAVLAKHKGDFTAARKWGERALAIAVKLTGPDSLDVARDQNNLGAAFLADLRPAEARPRLEAALAIWTHHLGPHHLYLAFALDNLGKASLLDQRYAEAAALFQRALDANHEDPETHASEFTGIGCAQLGLGKTVEAADSLTRALALRTGDDRAELATTQFALARALWSKDRARAEALAVQARDGFRETGLRSAVDLRGVEAWLARTGAGRATDAATTARR